MSRNSLPTGQTPSDRLGSGSLCQLPAPDYLWGYQNDAADGFEPILKMMRERAGERPNLIDLSLQQMRDLTASDLANWNRLSPYQDVEIEDRFLPSADTLVRVRRYKPSVSSSSPDIILVHGGGWVMGSIETHDGFARELCALTQKVVHSINYRLAPEAPYPAAREDVLVLAADLGVAAILVGDSAGALVALDSALHAHEASAPEPIAMALIYGAFSPVNDTRSHRLFGAGDFGLSTRGMAWFWDQMSSDACSRFDMLEEKVPDTLAPTLLVGAGLDCLLDDTLAMARRMTAGGVHPDVGIATGLAHGFIHMTPKVPEAAKAVGEIADWLRKFRSD